ncbi:MAG: hypothetical protein ABIQ95_03960 [Bdellovibrionia bacterium]
MNNLARNASLFLSASFILLTGCLPVIEQYVGDYSGKLLIKTPTLLREDDVTVRFTSREPNQLYLNGHSRKQLEGPDWQWEIRAVPHSSAIDLKVGGELQYVGRLNKTSKECFESYHILTEDIVTTPFARICFGKQESRLEVQNKESSIILTLHRSKPGEFPYLEDPSNYTTSELRNRAGQLGFDFRFSSEKLIRAQLNLRLSKLNLSPHLSASSVLNIGAYSIQGVITSVGELVPFLFPNHWLNVKEDSRLLKAQEYTIKIAKLDSMQKAESLGIILGRDQHLWTQLKKDREFIREIETEIQIIKQKGRLQPGSLLAIQSEGNNLDQTIAALESMIPLELSALSHAAGFINPNAIATLEVDPLGDIAAPNELDLMDLEIQAIHVAPEIKQLEELLEASKTSKRNRSLQWMSSTGDLQGSLGIGLPTYISIGSSHLRDLLTTKDQVNSIILRKVSDTFNDYYKSLDSYQFAVKGVVLQEKRINKARKLLQTGSINTVHGLRDSLRLLAINHTNVLMAQYAWYDSVSRLNRLLAKDSYATLLDGTVPAENIQ